MKMRSKIAFILGAVLFAYACSMSASSKISENALGEANGAPRQTLKEISNNLERYVGRQITVRGYLTGFGPIMILMENENSNRYKDPALLISDTELRLKILSENNFIDLKSYFTSLGCVDRFVEVTGDVGLIGEQKTIGIIRIDSLTAFDGASFKSETRDCRFPE